MNYNPTKWLHETVAEIMVRKKDAAYRSLKSKLLKEESANWDTKDFGGPDVTYQGRKSEEDDDEDDIISAESLGAVSDKDPSEAIEDELEDVLHQGTDLHEVKSDEVLEETSHTIGDVVMESIHEMADEARVENVSASLNDEQEGTEKIDEHQTYTDDTSSEVELEDTVVDKEEQIKSTSTVDLTDQTNVIVRSEALEEKTVENVDVFDFFGEDEAIKLPIGATNKTDEHQTKSGDTYSEANIKEESTKDSNAEEKTLEPSAGKEPDVSGVKSDEEPVQISDTATNDSDEDQIRTGDTFPDVTLKEESDVSNVEEFKQLKTKSTAEDPFETGVNLPETLFIMESVDGSLVADEEKPVKLTQVPTKDTYGEETKTGAYIEMADHEFATTESSPGALEVVEEKVKEAEIMEVKDNQVDEATEKDGGEGDVIPNDDENNNNNDRKKRQAKRARVRCGAIAKETSGQDELHEENEKGIKMFISSLFTHPLLKNNLATMKSIIICYRPLLHVQC